MTKDSHALVCAPGRLCAGHAVRLDESEPCSLTTQQDIDAANRVANSKRLCDALFNQHLTVKPLPGQSLSPNFFRQCIEHAAAEFAKPYIDELESTKARIAKLEAQNKAMIDAMAAVFKARGTADYGELSHAIANMGDVYVKVSRDDLGAS